MNKFKLLMAVSAIGLSAPAMAAPIVGLYNTGVTSGGAGWGVGGGVTAGVVLEPHWTMTTISGTAPSGAWNSGVAGVFPLNGPWANEDATSRWVAPTQNAGTSYDKTAPGLYMFSLTFDLTGFIPGSASFTGRFLSDNRVTDVLLNGSSIVGPGSGFGAGDWDPLASTGGTFLGGVNTLSFMVQNDALKAGNPLGLRVEFLTSSVAVVPEPATWGMMILGFGAIGGAMRRRKAAALRVTYA